MANRPNIITEPEFAARFWRRVSITDASDCWLWRGGKIGRYGVVVFKRRNVRATHISLFLDGRPRPASGGRDALHSCDNPPCVNPAHLRWGTKKDNAQDRIERNPGPYRANVSVGINNSRAKLTEDDIKMIRRSSLSQYRLARELGVSRSTICAVLTGQNWAHLK